MDFKILKELDSSLEFSSFSKSDDVEISTISSFDEVKKQSLVYFKSQKYIAEFLSLKNDCSDCTAVLQSENSLEKIDELAERFHSIMECKSVERSMCIISEYIHNEQTKNHNNLVDGRQLGTVTIHPQNEIAQNVFIGSNVTIEKDVRLFPGVVIQSDSFIGEGTVIYPNTTVYHGTKIGKNCRIHSNVAIGGDGYGYEFIDGIHMKLWQIGTVEIGNNVEIGTNSSVDRGAFKPTRIGDGTKIDGQVHIGHNCQIGKNVILCGHVGVAGSAIIEDYAVVGGKAGIGPGVTIGTGSQIAGNAMMTGSSAPGAKMAGHPARPLNEWLRSMAVLRKLTKGK